MSQPLQTCLKQLNIRQFTVGIDSDRAASACAGASTALRMLKGRRKVKKDEIASVPVPRNFQFLKLLPVFFEIGNKILLVFNGLETQPLDTVLPLFC